MSILYSCAAGENISTDIARQAVSNECRHE